MRPLCASSRLGSASIFVERVMTELSNQYPTDALQALDASHHLHPFTDHGALRKEGSRVIVKGEGCG